VVAQRPTTLDIRLPSRYDAAPTLVAYRREHFFSPFSFALQEGLTMQRLARMCGVLLATMALAAGCGGSGEDERGGARDGVWVANPRNCGRTHADRVFVCRPEQVEPTGAGLIYDLDAVRHQKVFITNIGPGGVGVRSAQGLAHPPPVRLAPNASWTLERIDV